MEFLIRRTSGGEGNPCQEARPNKFIYVDRRAVKTLAEAKLPQHKLWSDSFFASGTNHREENGMIARDLKPQGKWVISFNSLDELLKFNDIYGDLILGSDDSYKGIEHTIEIYDDYRE